MANQTIAVIKNGILQNIPVGDTPVNGAGAPLDVSENAGLATTTDVTDAVDAAKAEILGALPTVDPAVEGAIWNDGGAIAVSAGA